MVGFWFLRMNVCDKLYEKNYDFNLEPLKNEIFTVYVLAC